MMFSVGNEVVTGVIIIAILGFIIGVYVYVANVDRSMRKEMSESILSMNGKLDGIASKLVALELVVTNRLTNIETRVARQEGDHK
jgi:ABC-type lipoprotein release transport system permease subunit